MVSVQLYQVVPSSDQPATGQIHIDLSGKEAVVLRVKSFERVHCSKVAVSRGEKYAAALVINPKGIALYSPRLPSPWRGYLGSNRTKDFQPQRGCATSCVLPPPCATALRLTPGFDAGPKVARVSATLGFRAESRWDSSKFQLQTC